AATVGSMRAGISRPLRLRGSNNPRERDPRLPKEVALLGSSWLGAGKPVLKFRVWTVGTMAVALAVLVRSVGAGQIYDAVDLATVAPTAIRVNSAGECLYRNADGQFIVVGVD